MKHEDNIIQLFERHEREGGLSIGFIVLMSVPATLEMIIVVQHWLSSACLVKLCFNSSNYVQD